MPPHTSKTEGVPKHTSDKSWLTPAANEKCVRYKSVKRRAYLTNREYAPPHKNKTECVQHKTEKWEWVPHTNVKWRVCPTHKIKPNSLSHSQAYNGECNPHTSRKKPRLGKPRVYPTHRSKMKVFNTKQKKKLEYVPYTGVKLGVPHREQKNKNMSYTQLWNRECVLRTRSRPRMHRTHKRKTETWPLTQVKSRVCPTQCQQQGMKLL